MALEDPFLGPMSLVIPFRKPQLVLKDGQKEIDQKWPEVLLIGHSLKNFFAPVIFYSQPLADYFGEIPLF